MKDEILLDGLEDNSDVQLSKKYINSFKHKRRDFIVANYGKINSAVEVLVMIRDLAIIAIPILLLSALLLMPILYWVIRVLNAIQGAL